MIAQVDKIRVRFKTPQTSTRNDTVSKQICFYVQTLYQQDISGYFLWNISSNMLTDVRRIDYSTWVRLLCFWPEFPHVFEHVLQLVHSLTVQFAGTQLKLARYPHPDIPGNVKRMFEVYNNSSSSMSKSIRIFAKSNLPSQTLADLQQGKLHFKHKKQVETHIPWSRNVYLFSLHSVPNSFLSTPQDWSIKHEVYCLLAGANNNWLTEKTS